jgi:hypothetical protein
VNRLESQDKFPQPGCHPGEAAAVVIVQYSPARTLFNTLPGQRHPDPLVQIQRALERRYSNDLSSGCQPGDDTRQGGTRTYGQYDSRRTRSDFPDQLRDLPATLHPGGVRPTLRNDQAG